MHRTPPLLAIGLLLMASLVTGCDRVTTGAALLQGGQASSSAHAIGADGADGAHGAPGATVTSNTTRGVDNLPAKWPAAVALPAEASVAGTAEVTVNGVTRMAITGTSDLPPMRLRRYFERTLSSWDLTPRPWSDGRTASWERDGTRVRIRVDQDARGRSTFEATVDG